MYLSEVNSGKKFKDVEVEELEAEVTKANAKDESARNEQGIFWPNPYSCKYYSPGTYECGLPVEHATCNHLPL